ncbi:MAG: hypothetical protein V4447_04085 [Pseudomonadota bacterium]
MKKHWKKILLVLSALLIPLWVFSDPPVYFAKEIRGQIVDAETGQALKGVVVVATWQVYAIGIGSGGYGGSINTIEVLTDQNGKYFIPGWGPRPRPLLTYLDSRDPELRFFKPNYYPDGRSNALHSYENRDISMVRTSEWDGKVIKLTPFKGNNWHDYSNKLDSIWSPFGDCLRECPRLVLTLDKESKRIMILAPKEPFIPQILNIDNFFEADRKFLMRFKDENK